MIVPVSLGSSASGPALHDGWAVAPIAGDPRGGGSHDPAAGRRAPGAVHRDDAGSRATREPAADSVSGPRGPFGTSWSSIAERLIDTGSTVEALAGPKAESAMVTESHRRAGRRAMILAALAEDVAARPGEPYAIERPPGRAPQVVQPDPPVRIGTILDIVA